MIGQAARSSGMTGNTMYRARAIALWGELDALWDAAASAITRPYAVAAVPSAMLYATVHDTRVPKLGFGTFRLQGADAVRAVERALDIGYRHIDTAQGYDNEGQVGQALAGSGVAREEIFLVTKVRPSNFERGAAIASTRESLGLLGVDYIDLLLLHWPNPDVPLGETFGALAQLVGEGAVRHLGVSNFPTALVREAAGHANVFANQVEYHPYLGQGALLAQAREMGHLLTAYSPIAKGRVADDATLQEIAADHGKNPVQVTLRWLVQQDNVAAVPKSANAERQRSNFDIFDFELSEAEMARIAGLERGDRIVDPANGPDWD